MPDHENSEIKSPAPTTVPEMETVTPPVIETTQYAGRMNEVTQPANNDNVAGNETIMTGHDGSGNEVTVDTMPMSLEKAEEFVRLAMEAANGDLDKASQDPRYKAAMQYERAKQMGTAK